MTRTSIASACTSRVVYDTCLDHGSLPHSPPRRSGCPRQHADGLLTVRHADWTVAALCGLWVSSEPIFLVEGGHALYRWKRRRTGIQGL